MEETQLRSTHCVQLILSVQVDVALLYTLCLICMLKLNELWDWVIVIYVV